MWTYNYTTSTELYHHGILGMKWGVRRTPAQLGRYSSKNTKAKVRAIDDKTKQQIKSLKKKQKQDAKINKAKAVSKEKLEAAKKKYGVEDKPKPAPKPSIKDMSDDELRAKVNRIRLENDYKSLNPETVSAGKKLAKTLGNDVLKPVAINVGKAYLEKTLKKTLGLSGNEPDPYAKKKKDINNWAVDKAWQKMKEEQAQIIPKK